MYSFNKKFTDNRNSKNFLLKEFFFHTLCIRLGVYDFFLNRSILYLFYSTFLW